MFSIVIPLYNKEDFICRAVFSVLRQSHDDFELIVVDDGSTDMSVEQLAGISDSRLRIVRQTNGGASSARNRGIAEASRDWIALLDGDDYWFEDHLAELAALVAEHPTSVMVATSYLEGTDGNASDPGPCEARRREIDYFTEASGRIGIICSSAVAIRRREALRVGDFISSRTGEDLEYWARMALEGSVAHSDRITAYYFRNDGSMMAQAQREAKSASPLSLAQLWPSVAFLERVRDLPKYQTLKPAINRYIRAAGAISMLGALAQEQIGHARSIAQSLPTGSGDRAALIAFVLRMPAPLIFLLLRTYRLRKL